MTIEVFITGELIDQMQTYIHARNEAKIESDNLPCFVIPFKNQLDVLWAVALRTIRRSSEHTRNNDFMDFAQFVYFAICGQSKI